MRWTHALVLITAAACTPPAELTTPTTPSPTTTDPTPDPTTDPTPTVPARWTDCPPLTSEMRAGPECATYDVPLHWADADGPTLSFTVYRYLSITGPSRGQIWMLDGGPGGTGAGPGSSDSVVELLAAGWDLYIPSQRGTSGDDALSCTNPRDAATCHADLVAEWSLEGLSGFATGEAALDTQLAMLDAEDGRPQLLWGTSYGTYLAMRVLQIHDGVAGAVLDSSMTYEPDIWAADLYIDDMVWDLLADCEEEPGCASRFPGTVAEAIDALEDPDHCPDVDPAARGSWLGFALRVGPAVPLALASRLARCDAEDVAAFDQLEALLSYTGGGGVSGWAGPGGPPPGALNQAVYLDVVAHDFLPALTPAIHDRVIAESAERTFAGAGALTHFWGMKRHFPIVDGFLPDVAEPLTPPPVLVLAGGLDIQTPVAWGRVATEQLSGTLIEIPAAGHGVYPADACAQTITNAFLAAPASPLDLTCLSDAPGPDLVGDDDPQLQQFVRFGLGLSTLWPTL